MGCCNSSSEIKTVIEKFNFYNDQQFINYLENEIAVDRKTMSKDYSKINDVVNIFDDTILHYAVFHNRVELVKYLIEKGADCKRVNNRKKSPYDIAVQLDNKELISVLD